MGRPKAEFNYTRREPEKDLLYKTIRDHWTEFLSLTEIPSQNKFVPSHVKKEIEEYLKCGILDYGFVKIYCYDCGHKGLVAFSCKRRGFCPSCMGRRMNDEAHHLVNKVIPHVPVRQWVLSLPYSIRYLIAYRPNLTSKILKIFNRTVNSWIRRQVRKKGYMGGLPGSVTFIQNFGSALNLNPHYHSLFLNGAYAEQNGELRFISIPPPSKEDLNELVLKIEGKVMKFLKSQGYFNENESNYELKESDTLDQINKNSITHKQLFGNDPGQRLKRYGTKKMTPYPEYTDSGAALYNGFSLHAGVFIARNQREKLEKLIRYTARGPISKVRLTSDLSGNLIYKLKNKWADGTTHVSFSPLDFIARLVALIPPPRANLIRYHGVLAPNSKHRKKIVPKLRNKSEKCPLNELSEPEKRQRLRWADLLQKTFKIDVMECPKCKGRLEQIEVVKDHARIRSILDNMDIPQNPVKLKVVSGRDPPTLPSFLNKNQNENDFDQRPDSW